MARTPKPPKLSDGGGFNAAHLVVTQFALGFWVVFVGFPFGVALLGKWLAPQATSNAAAEIYASTIGGSLFILIIWVACLAIVTPAFWRRIFGEVSSLFGGARDSDGHTSDFWTHFRRSIFNYSLLSTITAIMLILAIISLVIFVQMEGMTFRHGVDVAFENYFNTFILFTVILWVSVAAFSAADAILSETIPEIAECGGLFKFFIEAWKEQPAAEKKEALLSTFIGLPLVYLIGIYIPIVIGEHYEGTKWSLTTLIALVVVWVPFACLAWWANTSDTPEETKAPEQEKPSVERPRPEHKATTEDDFAFDPNAFKEAKPSKPKRSQRKTAKPSQKGKGDTRHPDDVALWEVVNDAASTPEERKTALELILEREAERSQNRGKKNV